MALRYHFEDALTRRVRQVDARAVAALLAMRPGMTLLDVGGGTGAAAELVEPDAEVVVLEPHAAKVAHGRRARPRFRFGVGEAEALPFRDGSFDRALALVSFHHFRDQAAALREVHRVLSPGGRLVVQEFDPHERTGHRLAWLERRLRAHAHFVAPAELEDRLRDAGFRSVTTQPAARGYLVVGDR